jgi:hypothetical protein
LDAQIQVDRDHQRQGGKGDQVEIREPVLLLEPPKDEVQSHYASSTVRGATLPYVRPALSPRQKHVLDGPHHKSRQGKVLSLENLDEEDCCGFRRPRRASV